MAPEHDEHWVDDPPLQVSQLGSQFMQVFVGPSGYFVDGQTKSQLEPSKNLAPEQLRHSFIAPPEHDSQSTWHESHWLFEVFSNLFKAAQAVGHAVPSKNLPVSHSEHSVLEPPVHSLHSEWHPSQVFVPVFSNFPDGQVAKQLDPLSIKPASQLVQLSTVVVQVAQFVAHFEHT